MTEVLLRPLADSFMQVGVFVALLVAPFGWASYRWGQHLDAALVRHRRLGPVVAAALTMPPGCGGAIIVLALYARGAISYGAAVAALVATMGDATWVLLASDPTLTLQLKALLLLTGATTGYLVDLVGLSPSIRAARLGEDIPAGGDPAYAARVGATAAAGPGGRRPTHAASAPAEVTARLSVGPAGAAAAPLPVAGVGALPGLLWISLALAALVAIPATFRLVDPGHVGESLLGGVDPYLTLGLTGAVVSLVVFVRNGCRLADDDTRSAHPSSMADVLRQGGQEVAFITVWVATAYVAWSVISQLTGFDGSQLPLLGALGVLVGATVGLIPGCGVQIVFTGIFLAGGMPLSTLVANSISQDGDALLPLLAVEPRAAVLATVLTTVPALVVGSAVLLLGG